MRSFEFNYLVSSFHTRKPYFENLTFNYLDPSKALLLLEFWSFSSIWEKDSIKEKKGFGAYPFRNLLFFILLHPLSIISKPHFFFFFFSYFVFITLGPRSCRKRFPSPLPQIHIFNFSSPPPPFCWKCLKAETASSQAQRLITTKTTKNLGLYLTRPSRPNPYQVKDRVHILKHCWLETNDTKFTGEFDLKSNLINSVELQAAA